jgi:hypothetical protein
MKDLPAQHYLQIYRLKLEMARASPAGLEFSRRLVAALENIDADAPVRIETTQGAARFIDVRSGLLLAELPMGADD